MINGGMRILAPLGKRVTGARACRTFGRPVSAAYQARLEKVDDWRRLKKGRLPMKMWGCVLLDETDGTNLFPAVRNPCINGFVIVTNHQVALCNML
jgi:hypothetical protein